MQWSRPVAAVFALLLGAGGAGPPGAPVASRSPADAEAALQVALDRPLAHAPLDTPLILTGGFGEFRSNHFHAGLDLGTGGRVGRPVYAPLDGWIGRVRASGVGYGRSIYLNTDDGRLLVFAHLDAYAPPLAAFVAAAQESSGQYEQDLWPATGRFRVKAGQRIAWSGESGAGGPHLHFEIRRGDMAYNPLRAGLAIADTAAPTLVSLTLEPLDDASYVDGSAAPVTLRLTEVPPRVRVLGRVRAWVAARDGVWQGVDRMVPWSVGLTLDGASVECRFDSVSWATDMVESDYVYDTGRLTGAKAFAMWAPAGLRPRVLRATARESEPAGTLIVRPGDAPRVLNIVARDVTGRTCERSVILEPPAPGLGVPDTTVAGGRADPDTARWFELSALPDRFLRVTFRGAPEGSRGVTIGGRPASLRDGEWAAVVEMPASGSALQNFELLVEGRDSGGQRWRRWWTSPLRPHPGARGAASRDPEIEWSLPRGALFEPGPILYRWSPESPVAPAELVASSNVLELLPATMPMREPVRLDVPRTLVGRRTPGLFHYDEDGWSWVSAPLDSGSGRRSGEIRHLGRFALFADTLAPRVTPFAAPTRVPKTPYPRWQLESRVREQGSGVDARASRFEVNGRRVPSEWDPEKGILRWRPSKPPAPGTHRYTVIVTDRSGNVRRTTGRFTMR